MAVTEQDTSRVLTGLERDGWAVLPSRLPANLLTRLIGELEQVYADQRALQRRNGVGDRTDGTVHHLPCAGGSFLELLELEDCLQWLQHFFQGPYILNTYG